MAEVLWSRVSLGEFDHFATLAAQPDRYGLISPARVAALRIIKERFTTTHRLPLPGWVAAGKWTAIRINHILLEELFDGALPYSLNQGIVKEAVVHKTTMAAPEMLSSPNFDRALMEQELRVEGDIKTPNPLSVVLALPSGDWVRGLLEGRLSVTPSSFVTLAPMGSYTEVMLEGVDNATLKAIVAALGGDSVNLRFIMNQAVQRVFGCSLVMVRFTTSRREPSGGQSREVLTFMPGSEASSVVVGMDLMPLVIARRGNTHFELALGHGSEWPVHLKLVLPQLAHQVLNDLVKVTQHPLRVRDIGAVCESRCVVLGQLLKSWLSNRAGRLPHMRIQTMQETIQACQTLLGVSLARFVGRQEKGGGDPVAFVMEFPSVDVANAVLTANDRNELPEQVRPFLGMMASPESSLVFACALPPEALASLREKELKTLMTDAARTSCPRPANAEQ